MSGLKDGEVTHVSWPALLEALSDKERNQAILEVAFNYKRLREVPLELLQCGGLERLSLRGNAIANLSVLMTMRGLTEIDAAENRIEVLPADLGMLANLRLLALEHNHIQVLPQSIRRLTNLVALSLSHNKVTDMTSAILPPCLVQLFLARNGIAEIPPTISNLKALQLLDLCENRLAEAPDELFACASLRELLLGANRLNRLSPRVAALTQLCDLFLDRNCLTSLPEEVGHLPNLVRLSVGENQLTALPESIGQLQRLEELHAYNNELTTLPAGLYQLRQLTILELNENRLTALWEEVGNLRRLQECRLDHNELTSLPLSIGACEHLVVLHINFNRLQQLSPSIAKLFALEELCLSYNFITDFPEPICHLPCLRELDLSHNRLSALPRVLGHLRALRFLSINDNSITELPRMVGELKGLQELNLQNNPFTSQIPSSALKVGRTAVLQFLQGRYVAPVQKDDAPYHVIRGHLNSKMVVERPAPLLHRQRPKSGDGLERQLSVLQEVRNTGDGGIDTAAAAPRTIAEIRLLNKFKHLPAIPDKDETLSHIQRGAENYVSRPLSRAGKGGTAAAERAGRLKTLPSPSSGTRQLPIVPPSPARSSGKGKGSTL
eukprot:GGOE01018324.1.p1 GENE.GGOE01018324.1~~GGOE01018324.1.p1  ORF type:complete len:610 (-),score=190.95 GGOE01018324.1:174-2003(-)